MFCLDGSLRPYAHWAIANILSLCQWIWSIFYLSINFILFLCMAPFLYWGQKHVHVNLNGTFSFCFCFSSFLFTFLESARIAKGYHKWHRKPFINQPFKKNINKMKEYIPYNDNFRIISERNRYLFISPSLFPLTIRINNESGIGSFYFIV